MNKSFILIKLLFMVIGGLLTSYVLAEQLKAEASSLEELKTAIVKLVKEKDIPAVGIAMVDKNGPVWIGAIGKANIEHDVAADENTLFRIGSTSKMFLIMFILQKSPNIIRLVHGGF